jgi:hypothetical protein
VSGRGRAGGLDYWLALRSIRCYVTFIPRDYSARVEAGFGEKDMLKQGDRAGQRFEDEVIPLADEKFQR